MQSKILFINYIINEESFSADEIDKVYCEKLYYPSRKGKKAYYALKMSILSSDTEYNLGSYPKLPVCKQAIIPFSAFLSGKQKELNYFSGPGVTNSIGILFSLLMFVVSIIVLTNKEEQKKYDWDDDDEK